MTLKRGVEVARVEALAQRLYDARRIVLLGGDSAAVLVKFLHYNLSVIDLPAAACTTPGEVGHTVRGLGKSDRHCHHVSPRAATDGGGAPQRAREGRYCVSVTDTHLSPVARFAHEYFVAPVESALYGSPTSRRCRC